MLTSYKKKTQEMSWGLEEKGSGQSTNWSATERIHELQTSRSEHVGPGESELPNEGWGESQVACKIKHTWIDKSES